MSNKNINNKIFNPKGSYFALYKEVLNDDNGKINTTIKIGLFTKDKVLGINNKKILIYKDLLSDNTMGISLDENGNDIFCLENVVPKNLKKLNVISSDNCIMPYSKLMDNLKKKYNISDFSAISIGCGLVKFEEFRPEYATDISLVDLLRILLDFDKEIIYGDMELSSIKNQLIIIDNLKNELNYLSNKLNIVESDVKVKRLQNK